MQTKSGQIAPPSHLTLGYAAAVRAGGDDWTCHLNLVARCYGQGAAVWRAEDTDALVMQRLVFWRKYLPTVSTAKFVRVMDHSFLDFGA